MMIRVFQGAMSRAEALKMLTPSGPATAVRRLLHGPLIGMCDVFIPYRLYKITTQNRDARGVRFLAVDAVAGTLDPYEFPYPPKAEHFTEVETRNFISEGLPEEQTRAIVLGTSRRRLFSGGFFRLSNPVITAEFIGPEFHVPYWTGFYGSHSNVKVIMLDAVRRTTEGAKVSDVVTTWLRSLNAANLKN
jgi:hypothetical protein